MVAMKIKLKKLATIQTGYSFRSKVKPDDSGELSVIQMKDLLANNTVSSANLLKVSMPEVKEHHLVQKGDLIFRSRGLVVSSAIVLEDLGSAVVAAPLLKIRIKETSKALPEYINWYLSQRDAQAFFASRATGSSQKMVGKEVVEELKIFLPPLAQQKTIVQLAALSEQEANLLKAISEKKSQYISTLLMQVAKGEMK